MRSVVFSLLASAALWAAGDPVKEFTQDLSKENQVLLNDFFAAITDSSAGYVLHGDKPMSIETYDISSLRMIINPNPRIIAIMKGKELWKDLKVFNNKEYLLTTLEKEGKCHVVCINRKAFLQTVKDNLTLFRYVLGPALTPEGLLNELSTAEDHFYDVLKNNKVLTEILLGHGKQNALVHARLVEITDPTILGANEEFPLISKKLSRAWAASSEKYQKGPSFGFSSVMDEEFALKRLSVDSGKLKSFSSLDIPQFVCEPDSEETKSLLNGYEQNRTKIVKALSAKTFFEDSLRKFFTTNMQTVELPSVPKQKELYLPSSKEDTIRMLVQVIQKGIANEPYSNKKFQTAFLQGVTAREKGKQMPVPFQMKRTNDLKEVQREIEACKNLEKANAYFSRLSSREDLVALIPNEMFYKVIKSGKGNVASSKLKKVSFQYSYQILGDNNSKDWGIVNNENLGALIPGIAYALVGMQQGEEKVVYIHPKHSYGEDSFFAPNISIVAQIRLLSFEEGDQSVAILPPHQLEAREYRDLMAKFEVLRAEEIFDEGVEFWDSIKRSGEYIDFQTFQKIFNTFPEGETTYLDSDQEGRFVMDLQYHLLSLQR